MFSLISRRTFCKKIVLLTLVFAILGTAIAAYDYNREFFGNFKFYYLRSYKDIVRHRLEIGRRSLVGLLMATVQPTVYERQENTATSILPPARSIPVLVFHGIMPDSNRFDYTPEGFREDMFNLKDAGYQTVTLRDLTLFLAGRLDLPPKSFLLTFDDGRKDSYYPVDPILRDLGFNAVMFVASRDSFGENGKSEYYLSPNELTRMIKSGRWEIGSHAVQTSGGFISIDSHGGKGNFLSNLMWLADKNRLETVAEYTARINRELADSKVQIENVLGNKVLAFSYPFSDYGQQSINFPESKEIIRRLVKDNYALAFYQTWPSDRGFSQNHRNEDPTYIKRIEPYPAWSGDFLEKMMVNGREKTLPFTDNFAQNQGWRRSWGDFILANNSFVVRANASTTGSFVLLDGSYLWGDYYFQAKLDRLTGSHVSLVGRFEDEINYYSCNFSDATIRVEKTVNGLTELLAEYKNPVPLARKDLTAGIMVLGNKIGCLVGGEVVIAATDDSYTFLNGGIALKTWDAVAGNSTVLVRQIKVDKASENNSQPVRVATQVGGNQKSYER